MQSTTLTTATTHCALHLLLSTHCSLQDYVSHSFLTDVLELLRLLCEGHNNDMQNLLRNQPSELTDVDLIQETFKFLQAVEAEVDNTCVDQVSSVQ